MRRFVSLISIAFITITAGLVPAAGQQADLNAIIRQYNEYFAAGNYPAALIEAQKFEAAVKARFGTAHPNYANALNNRGEVYLLKHRYAEAVSDFSDALSINPDHAAAARNLPVAHKLLGSDH